MTTSPVDRRLLSLLAGPAPATVAEVLARMRAFDEVLPAPDGLKWFNWLYLAVTERIGQETAARRWRDGAWLERLDVLFGNLYFEAIRLWLTEPGRCPRAWVPLLESRERASIDRLQFALAGMNAHINRDLPVAVVETCMQLGTAPSKRPHHDDYAKINTVLAALEPGVRQSFEDGILDDIDRDLGPVDDVVGNWSITEARNAAWTNAEVLWNLRRVPGVQRAYLDALDGTVGMAGRGLLVPVL